MTAPEILAFIDTSEPTSFSFFGPEITAEWNMDGGRFCVAGMSEPDVVKWMLGTDPAYQHFTTPFSVLQDVLSAIHDKHRT